MTKEWLLMSSVLSPALDLLIAPSLHHPSCSLSLLRPLFSSCGYFRCCRQNERKPSSIPLFDRVGLLAPAARLPEIINAPVSSGHRVFMMSDKLISYLVVVNYPFPHMAGLRKSL